MFAIIWVIESGSSYRHIYFATPQCSFAHLRFPNDLDIVHDSLTKVKDQRNGKWQANLIILCCFPSKITWKIRQIRQSNSPFSLHSSRWEFWNLKRRLLHCCKIGGASLADRGLSSWAGQIGQNLRVRFDCFCMYDRSKILNLCSCKIPFLQLFLKKYTQMSGFLFHMKRKTTVHCLNCFNQKISIEGYVVLWQKSLKFDKFIFHFLTVTLKRMQTIYTSVINYSS